MRYIKKYKVFESTDEFEKEIKDILIELEDEGFKIIYDRVSNKYFKEEGTGWYSRIVIGKQMRGPIGMTRANFTWSRVKDPIIRLFNWYQDYKEDGCFKIFGLEQEFREIEFKTEDDFDKLLDSKSIKVLHIFIKS